METFFISLSLVEDTLENSNQQMGMKLQLGLIKYKFGKETMRKLRFSVRQSTISIFDIPAEILRDILSRLPVRSLLSCQCVCKHFYALIRDPKFIASHLNRTITTTATYCSLYLRILDKNFRTDIDHILLENSDSSVSSVSYVRQSNPISSHISIIGSCNGLFCADVGSPDEKCGSFFLLWNPATRQNRYLPKAQIDVSGKGVSPVLAFGFVPETNDYKVVRIISYHSSGKPFPLPDSVFVMQIEVYRMSTDSWTTYEATSLACHGPNDVSLEVDPILPLDIRHRYNTIPLKGAIHWLADDPRNEDETCIAIVAFDLKDEQLKLITVLTSQRIPLVVEGKLVILNESLSLIVPHQPKELGCLDTGFDIWVMNDYGVPELWTKQFSVEQFRGIAWPLGCWKDDILLMLENVRHKKRVFFYNLSTQERKNVPDLGCFSFLTFCRYVETLVPVSLENAVAEDADQ